MALQYLMFSVMKYMTIEKINKEKVSVNILGDSIINMGLIENIKYDNIENLVLTYFLVVRNKIYPVN